MYYVLATGKAVFDTVIKVSFPENVLGNCSLKSTTKIPPFCFALTHFASYCFFFFPE